MQGRLEAIQFIRYVPLLVAKGARVAIQCFPELNRIFKTIPGNSPLYNLGQPLPDFDFHCPVMSLPLACDTHANSIPASIPYLSAEPQLRIAWRNQFRENEGLRIGVVWAGRSTHKGDRERSVSLSQLAPLTEVRGTQLFSLQKGESARQIAGLPDMCMVDFSNKFHDFADTAALIEELDLVIAVDTAVAHLAGALGKAVWVLLPFSPDWRWMLTRADSPWYPTMRLFRQTTHGGWTVVIEAVRAALEEWVKNRTYCLNRQDG